MNPPNATSYEQLIPICSAVCDQHAPGPARAHAGLSA